MRIFFFFFPAHTFLLKKYEDLSLSDFLLGSYVQVSQNQLMLVTCFWVMYLHHFNLLFSLLSCLYSLLVLPCHS